MLLPTFHGEPLAARMRPRLQVAVSPANRLAAGHARSAESIPMTRMAAALATASRSQKKAVDSLIRELIDGGVDLRRVSLDEMKRRLSTQLQRQHKAMLAAGPQTVA